MNSLIRSNDHTKSAFAGYRLRRIGGSIARNRPRRYLSEGNSVANPGSRNEEMAVAREGGLRVVVARGFSRRAGPGDSGLRRSGNARIPTLAAAAGIAHLAARAVSIGVFD